MSTPATAARSHRALHSDDVMCRMLQLIGPRDGCLKHVASVCKSWRGAWRRRCKGLYRPARMEVGEFEHAHTVTALPDGVIVADYGNRRLVHLTSEGEECAVYCHGIATPHQVAPCGDGTAWVILYNDSLLCRVRLEADEGGAPRWPFLFEPTPAGTGYVKLYSPAKVLQQAKMFGGDGDDEYIQPQDVMLSGDRLVLLVNGGDGLGQVDVFDSTTAAHLYQFGRLPEPIAGDDLREPNGMGLDEDLCFIVDTFNQAIKIFNWRTRKFFRTIGSQEVAPEQYDEDGDLYWAGSAYRDARRSSKPCEFNEPVGVAFRDKRLYVSEQSGRRIQIISIPEICRGPVECLQIIASPNGMDLAGLCLNGNGLWCTGRRPSYEGGSEEEEESESEYSMHLFAPIV